MNPDDTQNRALLGVVKNPHASHLMLLSYLCIPNLSEEILIELVKRPELTAEDYYAYGSGLSSNSSSIQYCIAKGFSQVTLRDIYDVAAPDSPLSKDELDALPNSWFEHILGWTYSDL